MLKTQLRSKISALGSDWRDIEDFLTGGLFGALPVWSLRPNSSLISD